MKKKINQLILASVVGLVALSVIQGYLIKNTYILKKEAFVADLDAKSGASLKLTVLNKNGRIWTMVAGGGASVVYR